YRWGGGGGECFLSHLGCLGRARCADLPLAHCKTTVCPLLQVHVDMVLMIAIRTGAEHRGKATASVAAHPFAEVLGDLRVGQANTPPVSEPDQANIKSVRPAM